MLSIEEIKLLVEKLKHIKKQDVKGLIMDNLKILEDLVETIDANNSEMINRLDKTVNWFNIDNQQKLANPTVNELTRKMIQLKIFQFGKSNLYNSLEIGPGNGMFSKEFRAWRLNYFLDLLISSYEGNIERRIRKKINKRITEIDIGVYERQILENRLENWPAKQHYRNNTTQ